MEWTGGLLPRSRGKKEVGLDSRRLGKKNGHSSGLQFLYHLNVLSRLPKILPSPVSRPFLPGPGDVPARERDDLGVGPAALPQPEPPGRLPGPGGARVAIRGRG